MHAESADLQALSRQTLVEKMLKMTLSDVYTKVVLLETYKRHTFTSKFSSRVKLVTPLETPADLKPSDLIQQSKTIPMESNICMQIYVNHVNIFTNIRSKL